MKQLPVYIVGMLLMLVSSCYKHHPYPAAMQQAVCLIDSLPDSALVYLEAYAENISQEPEETQMYYHLLRIKANDKLYITHTSDSLINRIVEFYKAHDDKERLTEAYYYQGSVYRDLHNAPQAVECFRAAAETGLSCPDKRVMSKIYGQIAALFAYQGLYKESWDAARLEYAYADTAQNFQGMAFALRNMARIYHVFGKPDSAALAYRKGYDLAIQNHANHTAYSILSELGGLYYEEKQFDSAYSILRQVLSHYSFPNANMLMGGVYYELGKPDSAEHYIRQVFKYGTLHNKTKAYEIFAKISAYRQDYIQAYQYMRKYVAYQDSIDFITKTQEVAKVNALYDYRTTQKENLRLKEKTTRQRNQITELLLLFVFLTAVGIIFYLRTKKKRRTVWEQTQRLMLLQENRYSQARKTLQAHEQKIKTLTEQLHSATLRNDELERTRAEAQKIALEAESKQLHQSIEEQKSQILYFEQSEIYLKFHRATNSRDLSEEDWAALQAEIDSVYSQFTHRLLVLYPRLSPIEIRICYLIKIGIPVSRIAGLLNRSVPAITAARTRMYKKLTGETGTAEKTDLLIIDL